jgi:threonine dehydrogenase-like Zn-dependent dehydrogenase
MLKPGGKLMVVGIPRVSRISFSIDTLRHKEICIQNVRRQNECLQPTLDALASGKFNADPMVTHHFPFSKTKEAYDIAAEYADGIVKAMIDFQ